MVQYYTFVIPISVMAGRPQIFDEQEVLNKATQLFWTKGYEATSTDELMEVMGIGKSSFYHAFGGKRELFEKVMERFVNQSVEALIKELAVTRHPIQAIKDFFRGIAATSDKVHKRGCFMGNIVVELTNTDRQLEQKATKKLKMLENTFLEHIKKAQGTGELKTKEDAAVLARYLLNLWNGLNITRRIYPDTQALLPLIELQLSVLK